MRRGRQRATDRGGGRRRENKKTQEDRATEQQSNDRTTLFFCLCSAEGRKRIQAAPPTGTRTRRKTEKRNTANRNKTRAEHKQENRIVYNTKGIVYEG